MGNKVNLLIIDPQVDFCDPHGKLYVGGAEKDISRIANMIDNNLNAIEKINITLDSHQYIHIAHPIFWINSKGEHPVPFTIINVEDVENGNWRTTNPALQNWGKTYVKKLKDNNRYALCIWPPHCLIGSVGATVMPELFEATIKWEEKFRKVNYVPKGSSIFTENYSVIKADVEFTGIPELNIPSDPTTMINMQLVTLLRNGNDILISGQASSHCVLNTLNDICDEFSSDEIKKIIFLEDGSSPVGGFEKVAEDGINALASKGMRISRTDKYFK